MEWWVNWRWRLHTTILSPSWLFKSHKLCKWVRRITQSSKNLGRWPNQEGGRIKNQTLYSTLKPILSEKECKTDIKLSIFNALIESIFLYNSEIWSLTQTLENDKLCLWPSKQPRLARGRPKTSYLLDLVIKRLLDGNSIWAIIRAWSADPPPVLTDWWSVGISNIRSSFYHD